MILFLFVMARRCMHTYIPIYILTYLPPMSISGLHRVSRYIQHKFSAHGGAAHEGAVNRKMRWQRLET